MKIRLPYIRLRPNSQGWMSRSITAARLIVEAAGGNWLGVSELLNEEPLVLFNDGGGGNLLSLPMSEISMAAVRNKLGNAKTGRIRVRRPGEDYYDGFRGDSDFTWEHPEVPVV